MSNLFMVKGGRLATPRLEECGVEGIMRGLILDLAEEMGIPCRLSALSQLDLQAADELFLCNALIGLWPVRRVDRHAYTIGPVTRLLGERLRARQLDMQNEL